VLNLSTLAEPAVEDVALPVLLSAPPPQPTKETAIIIDKAPANKLFFSSLISPSYLNLESRNT